MAEPKGVVMCFIAPDGHVVASVSDFDHSGYGGFSLAQSQRIRCRDRLAAAVVRAMCSDAIAKALEMYDCSQIREKLGRNGYREHTVYIGHDESEED